MTPARVLVVLAVTMVLILIVAGAYYLRYLRNTSPATELRPLTSTESVVRDRLEQHVSTLADTIGERNIWHYEALSQSADYIEQAFRDAGYEVKRQSFDVQQYTVANIEAVVAGTATVDGQVVIGAHYDSVVGSPGANDNASGVAALLELARLLNAEPLPSTVRLVALINEEPPFFHTESMGSLRYATQLKRQQVDVAAMLSLETIGYYSDAVGSQRYPFPLKYFYPSKGNFVGFVGNVSSREVVRDVVASFRRHCDVPAESAAVPSWIPGVGWSDHWAFWNQGYQAIMVTDTAPFRYPFYHTIEDTPDKLDYDRLARIVAGLHYSVKTLAGAPGSAQFSAAAESK